VLADFPRASVLQEACVLFGDVNANVVEAETGEDGEEGILSPERGARDGEPARGARAKGSVKEPELEPELERRGERNFTL